MISEELRKQLLSLPVEQQLEVRKLLEEADRIHLSAAVERIRNAKEALGIKPGTNSGADLRELREAGWR